MEAIAARLLIPKAAEVLANRKGNVPEESAILSVMETL